MAKALVAGLMFLLVGFTTPASALVPTLTTPKWAELSSEQKQILSPLVTEWDQMESVRRKKWLEIAKRYPSMKPDEQQRLQARMREWAKLSPEQRRLVREQFKAHQQLPAEKQDAVKQKWQEYEALKNAPPPLPPADPNASTPVEGSAPATPTTAEEAPKQQ